MKRVGIMSMQRVENYGSFMQAYGLKKIVEGLGANVEFVDYVQGDSLISSNRNLFDKLKRNINILDAIQKRKIKQKMLKKYEDDFLPELGIGKQNMTNRANCIDTLIIGSDEVFNPIQPEPRGFSDELFGHNYIDKIPVISYAACFGYCNLEDLSKYGIDEKIKGMLKKFKSISVRDNNSFNIVKKLTNKDPELNLDPVLIYDFDDEIVDSSFNLKDYIVLYAYPGRFTKQERRAIKILAKKYNKMIVSIGFYHRIADICIVPGPFEILSLFKNADFVITDTFHGTVFSIKEKTNFCSIIRNTHSNKLSDLLYRLKLPDRIISSPDQIEKLYLDKPDFLKSSEIIDREKKKAIKYLRNNI